MQVRRACSSERRNILALNFERFPMFLKSWETKVDVVVLRGNMKNFGPVSFFSSFFSFLRRNLTIFGGGFGSFDLISRAKKKQKKDQSSLFSYCHEEQLCHFYSPTPQEQCAKIMFCVKKIFPYDLWQNEQFWGILGLSTGQNEPKTGVKYT